MRSRSSSGKPPSPSSPGASSMRGVVRSISPFGRRRSGVRESQADQGDPRQSPKHPPTPQQQQQQHRQSRRRDTDDDQFLERLDHELDAAEGSLGVPEEDVGAGALYDARGKWVVDDSALDETDGRRVHRCSR